MVRALETATLAAVYEPPAAVMAIDGNWVHLAAARRCPVARVDVDVFAGEAGGTVVRVAIADVERPAAVAGEVFDATLKAAGGFVKLGHYG